MKFYGWTIYLDDDKIGEIITPLFDPEEVCKDFLDKLGGFVGAGLRKVLVDGKGILRAQIKEES